MSTLHTDAEHPGRLLVFTKGAPGFLLAHCTQEFVGAQTRTLTDARRAEIAAANELLAGEAFRMIGVAQRELPEGALPNNVDEKVEAELVFLGLIGMIDPPREEAGQAVARAREAGIRSIMITGDHPVTASVIAKELGIASDGRAVMGNELEKMTDEILAETVREVSVYARVNPEHKLRIDDGLHHAGAVSNV